ncbi:peptidoglycan recognition protein [Streptomyces sp. HB-N217]|uniref:peptidoglycan recognition protein family protein n=1 Tax=Streptomyces sp. HB-N217 TaxID=2792016 RepID=UPI0018D688E7|nr:peptidoglycan recognition protein [Streptomyces sp. HB-N217]MBH5135516.1 peptidoglycan recognition protein [Streptomyces sp. HB-N217]MBH5135518.1 peptidoglycan recognition protein [Streptomyces sp. HB-N217]
MRGFLASSTGVTCAAALALPLAPPAAANTTTTSSSAPPVTSPTARPETYAPGGTQSLPLAPLARDRAPGAAEQGLPRRDVRHFSLVGVVWDNPATELHGRVEVRTRATATGAWSGWRELETHNADHAADPGTPESTSGLVRGATAPLWVGESDGVEVRVRAADAPAAARTAPAAPRLPTGLRLELVDPGEDTPPPANPARTRAAQPAVLPALPARQKTKPHAGPRPRITTRRGWGADEKLRQKGFVYTKKVKAAFVHHSDTGNNYRCSQAPSVIRGIYRYHVRSMGWRDLGYNFLVDKCGNIYEGRAGGVSKPVLGAHTLGFNSNSMGIAVLGTYSSKKPSSAALKAIARLTAWKVGLYGMNPRGKTYLKSGGGNLYPKGRKVRLNVISGHRDGFATNCPGKKLYAKLGTARAKAAAYQGR